MGIIIILILVVEPQIVIAGTLADLKLAVG